jgi:hypothetical protein
MKRLHAVLDDFEAAIRIYTQEQGGRKSPAYNGIRWDFAYADDPPAKDLFMIHPDFYDERGDSLSSDKPLSTDTELPARMVILNEETRQQVHRLRIREGTRFYCHEGPHRVAEGRITRITGLFSERPRKT